MFGELTGYFKLSSLISEDPKGLCFNDQSVREVDFQTCWRLLHKGVHKFIARFNW